MCANEMELERWISIILDSVVTELLVDCQAFLTRIRVMVVIRCWLPHVLPDAISYLIGTKLAMLVTRL